MRPEASWLDRQAYPFQSRYQPLSAGEMHYVDEGSGDPVLLVHGTPTWSFEYRHLIAALSKHHRCMLRITWGSACPSGRPALPTRPKRTPPRSASSSNDLASIA